MPTEAALSPVASATKPLKIIARSSPLPAFSAVAPSAANKPVPMIMAAVRNVAELLPRARCSAGPDRTPLRSGAIRPFLRLARPSCLPTRIRVPGVVHRKLSAQPGHFSKSGGIKPCPLQRLLLGGRRRFGLARFAQRGLEGGRQLVRRSGAPVVQEIDRRLRPRHVMVDRDDIDAVLAQRLEH